MTDSQEEKTATMRDLYEMSAETKKKYAEIQKELNYNILPIPPHRMNRHERRKMKKVRRSRLPLRSYNHNE